MNRRTFLKVAPALGVVAGLNKSLSAETGNTTQNVKTLQPIVLPKPENDGGKTLLAAVQDRKSYRTVSDKPLPMQTLSNLLWAAYGVNRQQGPSGKTGRTAPSAHNSQEIDLYVALPEGVYLYEPVPHRLTPIVAGDFRSRSADKGSALNAPVNIFFVVDFSRYEKGDPETWKSFYYVTTGAISQNIYLFAASQGLATWFHECNKNDATKDFNLRPQQRILFAQTVGYPT